MFRLDLTFLSSCQVLHKDLGYVVVVIYKMKEKRKNIMSCHLKAVSMPNTPGSYVPHNNKPCCRLLIDSHWSKIMQTAFKPKEGLE